MVDLRRPASLLPAVKCSSCKADIEISLMSDHICLKLGAASSPVRAPSDDHENTNEQALSQGTNSVLNHAGHKTPRTLDPLSSNDANATRLPFASQGYTLVTSAAGNAAVALSGRSSRGRVSPHPKLLRSTTAPVPRLCEPYCTDSPPNLECAFPPFPTYRVQKTRSPSPINPKPNPPSESASEPSSHDPSSPPLSLRSTGSANVLRRMNLITPGPFDTRKRKEGCSTRAVQRTDVRRHSRTSTTSSNTSMEGPASSDGDAHSRRPSIATSEKSSLSQRYRYSGLSVSLDLNGAHLPSGPPPPRPARPDTLGGFLEQLKGADSVPQPLQLRVEQRSKTFPAEAAVGTSNGYATPVVLRTPSGLAVTAEPPTSASENTPVPHPGGVRGERPRYTSPEQSEFARVRNPDMASLLNACPEGRSSRLRFDEAGMTPQQSELDGSRGHGLHPSSASASSLGSDYFSDVKGRSSRSSPARSQTSSIIDPRPSQMPTVEDRDDASDASQAFSSAKWGVDHTLQMFQPPLTQFTKPNSLSFSRLRPPEPLATPQRTESVEAPSSTMDPALHRGGLGSRVDAASCQIESTSALGTLQTAGLAYQTHLPVQENVNGWPTDVLNGTCRGCGEAIRGKSVKAADGRLTGRYHKLCFLCNTCSEPFQTVDFYVLDNYPYCERHYHTLNGSLCQNCDEGIEGQYLETQSKRKFHPRCFTCRDCEQILLHDYYELSTDVFHCERHAFRAAQQSTFLGRKRRYPERRTTRLLMMAS